MKKSITILALTCIIGFSGLQSCKKDEPADANLPVAVDLGLSVKWASCNVGAASPKEFGNHYYWGSVTPVEDDGRSESPFLSGTPLVVNIVGTQYDVAHVSWGGSWVMPTRSQMQELIDNCTWESTTENGVIVYKVTGPNGNFIYLPAAGVLFENNDNANGEPFWQEPGIACYYWTGESCAPEYPNNAWGLRVLEDEKVIFGWNQEDGFSVRPVTK